MPRHPRVSATTVGLSDTVFSALVARAKSRPGSVYPLHVGDTYLEPLPAARAESQRTDDVPRLHNYSPVQGEPVLLDAIQAHLARRAGSAVDRESLQVMSGATGGLSVVCEALLDPGDEVLVPAPFWPLIRGTIAARGGVPVEIPFFTRLDDPSFNAEAVLEAAVTPKTVAVYVNSPNNPTGRVLSETVVAGIARVANRHGLWVMNDEAYAELAYVDVPTPPLWTRKDLAGRVISTHSISKSHALAGARVGFTHGPRETMAAIRGMQSFQTYCAARPMQFGAARALNEGAAWIAEARRLYFEAGSAAARVLGIPPPQGGTFLFMDISSRLRPGETPAAFLERCLDAGVLLTPGSACGRDYANWVRICFTSVPPEELSKAIERLRTVLG